MEVSVLNIQGTETGKKVNLPDSVFGIEPNDHAIYMDVRQYLAAQRQGTHKSKQRNEVSGSTRKLKKQKGTGGARAGSIKSPVFRGGGRIFGPQPRDYDFKLNKKVKKLARKSALSHKATAGTITVVEDFNFETPKTKSYLDVLKGLSLSDKKVLLVTAENNPNIYLSSRNIPNTKVLPYGELNTYHILNADHLVILEGSVSHFNNL